jgi:hypothetical protein
VVVQCRLGTGQVCRWGWTAGRHCRALQEVVVQAAWVAEGALGGGEGGGMPAAWGEEVMEVCVV